MKKLIICLANSWKSGGRCVAGIEVISKDGGYEIVKQRGEPIWVRPVSNSDDGEVPTRLVATLKLLDVVEVECTDHVPIEAQVENWTFELGSLKRQAHVDASVENLSEMTSARMGGIFGNHGKAVHSEVINEVGYSLLLIRADEPGVHVKQKTDGKSQIRMKFLHQGTEYDLAVTDPAFQDAFHRNPNIVAEAEAIFLTLSLARTQNEYHTKLVAGVVIVGS